MVHTSSAILCALVALSAVMPVVANRDRPFLETRHEKPAHSHHVHMVGFRPGHEHRYSHSYGYHPHNRLHHHHHHHLLPHRHRKKGHHHKHFRGHKFKNGYHHAYGYHEHHWPHAQSPHSDGSARVHRWHAWAWKNDDGQQHQQAFGSSTDNEKIASIDSAPRADEHVEIESRSTWEDLEDLD